jgi:hypothetical protein
LETSRNQDSGLYVTGMFESTFLQVDENGGLSYLNGYGGTWHYDRVYRSSALHVATELAMWGLLQDMHPDHANVIIGLNPVSHKREGEFCDDHWNVLQRFRTRFEDILLIMNPTTGATLKRMWRICGIKVMTW